MSSFRCPRCPKTLGFVRRNDLRWWQCPDDHGRAFNFTVIRKRAGKDRFKDFWTVARTGGTTGTVGCPSCRRPMTVVTQQVAGQVVELDVCRSCQLVWFDAGEDTRVAGELPTERPDPLGHLTPEARLEIQKAEAQLTMAAAKHQEGYEDTPGHVTGLDTMGAMLGLPVEVGAPARTVVPVVSWGLALAIAAGSVHAWLDMDRTFEAYGLLSDAPMRQAGVPAVVGLLTDPRPFSVLLNLGVFIRLGDNVENLLGRVGFVLLLGVASVSGWLVHVLGMGAAGRPMLGLTAAAAATFVLYALRYPDVRLGWYTYDRWSWFRERESGWFTVPVRWAAVGWVALAAMVPWMEASPDVPNSWAEALVGAVVGVVAWGLFGRGVVRHPDER